MWINKNISNYTGFYSIISVITSFVIIILILTAIFFDPYYHDTFYTNINCFKYYESVYTDINPKEYEFIHLNILMYCLILTIFIFITRKKYVVYMNKNQYKYRYIFIILSILCLFLYVLIDPNYIHSIIVSNSPSCEHYGFFGLESKRRNEYSFAYISLSAIVYTESLLIMMAAKMNSENIDVKR